MITTLKPLINKSTHRSFTPGSIIIYQGEVPRSACVLIKGVVRVYGISTQGEEQIVAFHVAGEFFPSSWIFSKAPSTLFFYEALTDCEVAFIPKKELVDYMLADPTRTNVMLDYFTTNYAASLIRISGLEQPKARDKLIYTLYFLCQRYVEVKDNSDYMVIPISLTHQSLASFVGLTRETTAMEMSKLKKQKVINYNNQQYTVNMRLLLDIIGEDSLKNISIAGS